jgi:Putative peptidoglycan binding domain
MSAPMDTGAPAPGALADGAAGPDRQMPRRPRRRGRLVAGAAVVVLVVAAGAVVAVTDPFGGQEQPPATVAAGTARAVVREGPLSSQVNQSGTLSYTAQPDGSPYSVVNHAGGIYTSLPSAGQVVECGQVLYRVGETPVVLLCGGTPAYRDLSLGDSGADARELNANLVRLGYADPSELDPSSDGFTSETASALQRLQDKLGVDQTGSLDLGQAVFLPGPLRITRSAARLGARAAPGVEIAQATSTGREVIVNLNASQQSQVKTGNRAQITLPDNRTTPGVVRRIGTVASAADGNGLGGQSGGSGTSTATIPVHIALQRPKDAGALDEAPVQVQITTAGVRRALIVPVTALVGQAGTGFAVEKVDAQGAHRLVPVTLGLFDDADGLVQVSGDLKPGDHVVVPAT